MIEWNIKMRNDGKINPGSFGFGIISNYHERMILINCIHILIGLIIVELKEVISDIMRPHK